MRKWSWGSFSNMPRAPELGRCVAGIAPESIWLQRRCFCPLSYISASFVATAFCWLQVCLRRKAEVQRLGNPASEYLTLGNRVEIRNPTTPHWNGGWFFSRVSQFSVILSTNGSRAFKNPELCLAHIRWWVNKYLFREWINDWVFEQMGVSCIPSIVPGSWDRMNKTDLKILMVKCDHNI